MPFINGDGIFNSPEAVVTNVFMQLPVVYDDFKVEVSEIFGADDKVATVGYYTGSNKAIGNPFKANATHIRTMNKGKMVHFFRR